MTVAVTRSAEQADAGLRVHVGPRPGAEVLVHEAHLPAGVRVGIDLIAPQQWCSVSYRAADETSRSMLDLLTAHEAAEAPKHPWLRVAVVDALDRWLHLPLEQSLVDAERGVARGRAARTLPHGPARAVLTGEALRLARRASHDLTVVLRRLARRSTPLPGSVVPAIENLVDGYRELVADVAGPDRELASVLDGWRRLSRRIGEARRPTATTASPSADAPQRPPAEAGTRRSMIDPRQIRARVLGLSSRPAAAEITISEEGARSGHARVRVPAFDVEPDSLVTSRLVARVVDMRTGEPKGHALLRAVGRPGAGQEPYFEADVPLCGVPLSDVRANVFESSGDHPPSPARDKGELLEGRRAVVFLAEWRRLVGLVQLWAVAAAPARRLRELATRLEPDDDRVDAPLFTGGPSRGELEALAALGDDELVVRLQGDEPVHASLHSLTRGAAALLVAEVAALLAPQD